MTTSASANGATRPASSADGVAWDLGDLYAGVDDPRIDQDLQAALKRAPVLTGIGRWHRKAGIVTHVFTHFPLELVVYTARVPARVRAPAGMRWVPVATLQDEALPNVMRKVIAHALDI